MDEGDESSNEQMETDKVVDGEEQTDTKEDDEKTAGKDGEEEPSNLQLAWEMLELAKVIYTKVVDTWPKADDTTIKPFEEKLHRTILTLGEISIENENYSQAVEDIQMCLKKEGAFKKDSRLVAETHYQLGVARGYPDVSEEGRSLQKGFKTCCRDTLPARCCPRIQFPVCCSRELELCYPDHQGQGEEYRRVAEVFGGKERSWRIGSFNIQERNRGIGVTDPRDRRKDRGHKGVEEE